jgi:hypothetical protein
VHQRLLTGAKKSTGKDESKREQGAGKGRGAPRGGGARSPKPEKEISFLDSLNSY